MAAGLAAETLLLSERKPRLPRPAAAPAGGSGTTGGKVPPGTARNGAARRRNEPPASPQRRTHRAPVNIKNSQFLRASAGGWAAQSTGVSRSTICRKQRPQKVFEKTVKLSRYKRRGKVEVGVQYEQKEGTTKIALEGPCVPAAQQAAQLRTRLALPLDAVVNG
jgi:hypothetical protein